MTNITKDQIREACDAAFQNNMANFEDQYIGTLNQLTPEQQNNPLMRETIAATIIQRNVMDSMQEILVKLLAD